MANLNEKPFMGLNSERKNNSLSHLAYHELEEAIVTLRLAPGEVLSETNLSKEMNIGRTPIREALQRLAREGLIVILPRKGILVSDINPGKQLLVLEVRRVLERSMARTASVRCTDEQRALFFEIADGLEHAASDHDGIAFMRLDKAFNLLFSNASHNEYAVSTIGLLNGLSRRFWYAYHKRAADLPHCARLHAKLATCIGNGDPEGAAIAADNLVDYTEIFTRSTF
jgi:DNA-binding GntR family transcriptional regulator